MPWAQNKYIDALATTGSRIGISDDIMDVQIIKRTLQANSVDLFPNSLVYVQDRRNFVVQNLDKPSTATSMKNLTDLAVVNDELIIEAVKEYLHYVCP